MGFIDKRSDNRGMKRVISPDGMKSIQVARIIRTQNSVEIHECKIKDDAHEEDDCVFIFIFFIKGEGSPYTCISYISNANNADDNDDADTDTDADDDADGGQSTQDTGDEECYPHGECITDYK